GPLEWPVHDPPGGGAEIYCGYTAIRDGCALAQERGGDSGVHRDVQARGVSHVRAGDDVDGVGDVFGEHFAFEQGALGVEGAEVFFLDAVGRGAVGAPSGGEDARALHHAVRVDAVDLDSVFAQFDRQQPHLVCLVGLGGGVGDVVGPGEDGVLGGDVDDVPAHVLFDEDLRSGLGDQEGALGHHIVLAVPVGFGGFQQRARERQAGVVDHQVHPTEGEDRLLQGGGDRLAVGNIHSDPDRDIGATDALGDLPGFVCIQISDDDAGTFGGEPLGDRLTDTGGRE